MCFPNTQQDISAITPYGLKLPKALNNHRESLEISVLAGERTSSGIVLNDPEDGFPKIFFVFPNLCLRIIGTYQLKCTVVDIEKQVLLTRGELAGSITSDPFTVFSLKEYTGGGDLTGLAKSFALQGEWI